MRDWPTIILVATVWAYWIGVGMMIARVHRKTHKLGGLVPEQSLERYMWLVWVPVIAAWITLPYLALIRSHPPLAMPALARQEAAFMVVRWIAVGGAVASLLLTSLCWSRMGSGWRMGISTGDTETLITDGMFRYVRHPIYALSMLLMTCSMIVAPTIPMLVVGAIHFVLLQIKARNEERHLTAVHGDVYRHYLEHTDRFVPWRSIAP